MNIFDISNVPKKEGEVGIEIEVEGVRLPDHIVGWNKEEDGSLRGEACEYVLRIPARRDQLDVYLGRVASAYDECDSVVTPSSRQSIHIHINVQDLSLTEIYNFMYLFLIYETNLVNFCGDDRVGNLFCLRSSDAEYLIKALERASTPHTFHQLDNDDLRYSAMNVVSLFKFGSLEFRSMRGTDDTGLIGTWIDVLLQLKDSAKSFNSPVDILNTYKELGIESFTEKVLGKHSSIVTSQHGWTYSTKIGMRSFREVAYGGDWHGLGGTTGETKEESDFDIKLSDIFSDISLPSTARPMVNTRPAYVVDGYEEDEEETDGER